MPIDPNKDPWEPVNMTVIEAIGDFQADVAFDYIPIGAALSKYSSLLEVLSYNREKLTISKMQDILSDAHNRMMKKLNRGELHLELNGSIPRLPQ